MSESPSMPESLGSLRPYWPFSADRPVRRVVVKCGSNVLSAGTGKLDLRLINQLALEMSCAMQGGMEVIYVSSGAVSCGIGLTGRTERPRSIPEKQALAAIGQCRLMHVYSSVFETYDVKIAQVLLTAGDMEDRRRYLNIEYCLTTLLAERVLPVINENDTVTVEELKFGDNDGLAALIAAKMNADMLVILTDVEGLMDANPKENDHAHLVPLVGFGEARAFGLTKAASAGRSKFGSGGMSSKLAAAQMAGLAGVAVVIANGRRQGVLGDVLGGREVGTLFVPRDESRGRMPARDRWILGQSARGRRLVVDDGALKALLQGKKSLLAVGVAEVQGEFERGDVVEVSGKNGVAIAKGLVNFTSEQCRQIRGMKTASIEKVLGQVDYPEVIHRDNLVMLEPA